MKSRRRSVSLATSSTSLITLTTRTKSPNSRAWLTPISSISPGKSNALLMQWQRLAMQVEQIIRTKPHLGRAFVVEFASLLEHVAEFLKET
jgi:hypothetical protein